MKTKSFIICFCLFFISSIMYSQSDTINPSVSSKKCNNDIGLKKGNWAIMIELGTVFGYGSDFFEAYTLTAKKHISDRFAIRASYSLNYKSGDGTYENWAYKPGNEYENEWNNQFSITAQYYFFKDSPVNPFISAGPYGFYNGSGVERESNSSYLNNLTYDWGAGLFASFGVEFFFHNSISIAGEYIFKGTFGKYYYKHIYYSSETGSDYIYRYKDELKLNFNTARLGFSVYF